MKLDFKPCSHRPTEQLGNAAGEKEENIRLGVALPLLYLYI